MKKFVLALLASSVLFSCKKNGNQNATPILDSPAYSFFQGSLSANNLSTVFTNDGNLAVLGAVPGGHALLLKVSVTGNQLLNKEIPLPDSTYGAPEIRSIAVTADNGYMLCGTSYNNNTTDFYLVKLNSAGNIEWTKTYGGDKEDYGYYIIKTRDGNYLLCGITYSFTAEGYDDIYLVKVDKNGGVIWSHAYPRHEQQTPFNLIEMKNGDYMVTGTDEPTGDGRIVYMLRVNASGDKLWENTIGPVDISHWKWSYSSAECSNGDLMLCGDLGSKLLLIRADNWGNELWEKTYFQDSSYGGAYCMKVANDNSSYITGSCSPTGIYGSTKCFLLKTDNDGNQVFFKKLPGAPAMVGQNLLLGTNNDVILTGNQALTTNTSNIFLTRTDANGNYK